MRWDDGNRKSPTLRESSIWRYELGTEIRPVSASVFGEGDARLRLQRDGSNGASMFSSVQQQSIRSDRMPISCKILGALEHLRRII